MLEPLFRQIFYDVNYIISVTAGKEGNKFAANWKNSTFSAL